MSVAIRRLDEDAVAARIEDFAALLTECVEGGASIGFLSPLSPSDARVFWAGMAASIGRGERFLLAAFDAEALIGAVQLVPATLPNQPHRADVSKMMVRPEARGRGVGAALLGAVEAEAVALGRTLLVLDTATGSDAERLYARHGWERSGVIPDYALWPDGGLCATTFFFKRLAT